MTPIQPFAALSAIRRRAAIVPFCVLVLGGCASLEEQPATDAEPVLEMPDQARPDGSVRVDTDDARVAQLWSAAEQSVSQGDAAAALEHLYSALELNQENPMLWSRAAELQLDRDEAALAETLALKSNEFALDNRALQYRNWLIIEHARSLRGDLLGKRTAHRKVQQYQYR